MSKLISVSDEVYESLKRRKNGRSFSEVIKDLEGKNRGDDIMRFAGMFKDDKEFADAMDKIMKKGQKMGLKRVKL